MSSDSCISIEVVGGVNPKEVRFDDMHKKSFYHAAFPFGFFEASVKACSLKDFYNVADITELISCGFNFDLLIAENRSIKIRGDLAT